MSYTYPSTVRVSDHKSDPSAIREAFAQFPSGVAVIATHHEDERHAMVASSFMVGVSLHPCLVAVAVQKTSETWIRIKDADRVGVSIFGRGQGDLVRQLASKDRAGRFERVAIEVDPRGAVFLEEAALWLECTVHRASDAGDHWMILLEVQRLGVGENEPLVWHGTGFRELASLHMAEAV